jgi:hypothetical protein
MVGRSREYEVVHSDFPLVLVKGCGDISENDRENAE